LLEVVVVEMLLRKVHTTQVGVVLVVLELVQHFV
jgi:hypothetical protein